MKHWLNSSLSRLRAYLLSLSERNRRLVVLVTVLLIFAVSIEFGWNAPGAKLHQQSSDYAKVEASLNKVKKQYEEMQAGTHKSEREIQQEQIEKLQAEIAAIDKKIDNFSSQFIASQDVTGALKKLLKGTAGVKIVRMENKEPQVIEMAGLQGRQAQQYYRHDIELELEGSYRALLSYLQKMEQLPWRLNWQHYHFESVAYPRLKAVIQLSTLANSKTWISG